MDAFVTELRKKLRAAKDEDYGSLATRSYSQLDLMDKCNMRFKLRHIDKHYSSTTSLPMEVGSILHKGLELKGRSKMERKAVDYEWIKDQVLKGCEEVTDKGSERIIGINDLKKKYLQEWYAQDESTGKSYEDKMKIYFDQVLPERMEDDRWEVLGTEMCFDFVYDERVILHGFIDRVDKLVDEESDPILKVTDYKSSKKIYDESLIKTPMQMVIYALACLEKYGVVPEVFEYDFILLDQVQNSEKDKVCSAGYLKRGIKKLDKMLDRIDEMAVTHVYAPSPTPLCHWCDFCKTNPRADGETKYLCTYHSNWTPSNKVFSVNQEFDPVNPEQGKRKLIF